MIKANQNDVMGYYDDDMNPTDPESATMVKVMIGDEIIIAKRPAKVPAKLPKNKLAEIKAALNHKGPGNHPSGSSQDVHGDRGGKAGGRGSYFRPSRMDKDEEKIYNASRMETSYFYDKDGKLVFGKSGFDRFGGGKSFAIEFTWDEIDRVRGNTETFLHNHPVGGSFSKNDIAFAREARIKNMVVVGPTFIESTGEVHNDRYIMQFPDSYFEVEMGNIRQTYHDVEKMEFEVFQKRIDKYQPSKVDVVDFDRVANLRTREIQIATYEAPDLIAKLFVDEMDKRYGVKINYWREEAPYKSRFNSNRLSRVLEVLRPTAKVNGRWVTVDGGTEQARKIYIPDDGETPPKEKLKNTLARVEGMIRNQDFESGYVYSRWGAPVLAKDGEKDVIYWTESEFKMMAGNILTHNHPSGSPFSKDDLLFMSESNMYEIRAAGSEYTYIMTDEKWKDGVDELRLHFNDSVKEVMMREKENGNYKEFNHEVLKVYAKRSGLKYKRVKTKAAPDA